MSTHNVCFCREIKKNIMWIRLLSGAMVRRYVTYCVLISLSDIQEPLHNMFHTCNSDCHDSAIMVMIALSWQSLL